MHTLSFYQTPTFFIRNTDTFTVFNLTHTHLTLKCTHPVLSIHTACNTHTHTHTHTQLFTSLPTVTYTHMHSRSHTHTYSLLSLKTHLSYIYIYHKSIISHTSIYTFLFLQASYLQIGCWFLAWNFFVNKQKEVHKYIYIYTHGCCFFKEEEQSWSKEKEFSVLWEVEERKCLLMLFLSNPRERSVAVQNWKEHQNNNWCFVFWSRNRGSFCFCFLLG
jgi:hypothetical protein